MRSHHHLLTISVGLILLLQAPRAAGQCLVHEFASIGARVAADGGFTFVGAPVPVSTPGKVLVYRSDAQTWELQAVLTSDALQAGFFGSAMAADNGAVAIGAGSTSFVEVYRLSNGVFQLEQQFLMPGVGFGWAVDLRQDLLVIGAIGADARDCPMGGKVFLYRHDGEAWNEEAQLEGGYCGNQAGFGGAVATASGVVLVGDHSHDGPLPNTGAVFAFRLVDDAWVFEQTLKPSDVVPGGGPGTSGAHWFGFSIALDKPGQTAIIGAKHNRVNGLNQAGSAYVFEHDGEEWIEKAKLTADPPIQNAHFGEHVAISDDGDTIVISSGGFTFFFQTHFFRRVPGPPGGEDEWVEVLTVPGTGFRIDVSGDRAVAGLGSTISVFAGINDIDCNDSGNPDGCDIALGFSRDVNNDGIPDECQALPDLTGDGAAGVDDVLALLAAWGPCPEPEPSPLDCPADLTGDGAVGVDDLLILLAAWGPLAPPPQCPPDAAGDCCAAHLGPGCADESCCQAVCEGDPFCCTTAWDMVCVHAARDLCGCPGPAGCGDPDGEPCCLPGGVDSASPGCSDGECCQFICDYMDGFCCEVLWDESCEDWAWQLCTCPHPHCTPDSGDCCVANPFTAGCNDLDCCEAVCGQNIFCCTFMWTSACADQANDICDVCQDDGGD